jgi:hypothetical protein
MRPRPIQPISCDALPVMRWNLVDVFCVADFAAV